MRGPTDAEKVQKLMRALGEAAKGPGKVYLTGGATAVLFGWRGATADVDLKFEPEPEGVFAAIPNLKNQLDINIELASPDHFIPAVEGWQERSLAIGRFGAIDFYHYDLIGQALAKIERGHDRDLADVREMLQRRLVTADDLRSAFESIKKALIRYPAVDAEAFASKVHEALADVE